MTMRKYLALALLFAFLFLARPAASKGVASLSAAVCGNDICESGESCSNCIWDCGVCNDSGGITPGVITGPTAKTVSVPEGSGAGYITCPVSYSSYTSSGGINTTVRFRVLNPSGSSTGAFRLTMSSSLGWFVPKNLTYALPPDGYASDGSPYWDIPPLGRNESTEIFFTAKGSVGLVSQINLNAAPLARWQGGCSRFAPAPGMMLGQNISGYLDSLNRSQGVTSYFESSGMSLAHLEKNGSFAVFRVGAGNVSVVTDPVAIGLLVAQYAAAASQPSTADTSKPYAIVSFSRQKKAAAESQCLAITGMDKHECVDRPTCRLACAAVPACWYVGQVGWPFIDGMLTYKIGLDAANAALGRAENSSLAFSQSPSYSGADAALSDIEALNKYETTVIYHPIFTTYNFCPPPEYAIPQMIDARRQLLNYMDENCVQAQAGRMTSESAAIAPGLRLAEDAAAARAAAEALASMAANASACGNLGINGSANMTPNGSSNASMCGNATVNATANQSALNATVNGTANTKGNASGNATVKVNASTGNATQAVQNASPANVTVTIPVPGELARINQYCPATGALLSGFVVLAILSQKGRKRKSGAPPETEESNSGGFPRPRKA